MRPAHGQFVPAQLPRRDGVRHRRRSASDRHGLVHARPPAEREALLRQAFTLYAADFLDLARTSIETTNDLFELSDYVSRAEAQAFQDKRADWSKKLDVPAFTPDMEVAYFSCCVPAYDAKVNRMATNLSGILQKTGVKFGTLGTAEKCCGESVRKCGNEELFTSLATSNIEAFKQAGVKP